MRTAFFYTADTGTTGSDDLHLHQFIALEIGQMYRTGDTRIKTVYGTQNLDRLFCIV